MTQTLAETRAALIVSSEVISGQQVADKLQIEPSKIFTKGDLVGTDETSRHPLNIVMFSSGVGTDKELEKHIEAILDFCEPRKKHFRELKRSCRSVIHCSYYVGDQGGWTLSPRLCRRMASMSLEFVFNVEHR